MYVMSFSRANIGRWGRGENIAIFSTLISTSHVEKLCPSLPQTNYSTIVATLMTYSIIQRLSLIKYNYLFNGTCISSACTEKLSYFLSFYY